MVSNGEKKMVPDLKKITQSFGAHANGRKG
jgi:hypothetical protein